MESRKIVYGEGLADLLIPPEEGRPTETELEAIIRDAIAIEEKASRLFAEAMAVVKEPGAKRLLAELAWEEALEIIAAACLYTARKWGPDRVFGFSPIPAMSYLSYAAGSRFLQLFGGLNMSFYDWYADLPNAFPEVWGDQTDVCESADWYNAGYIISMGSNLNMTRTPDVHFISEARHRGTKFVVIAPDFSQVAKYADWWVPIQAGQDTALWMAVNHVILQEFYVDRQVPYFLDYLQRYTDGPFLVQLVAGEGGYQPGQFLRANQLTRYPEVEYGDWKLLVYDQKSGQPRMPKGSLGFRWDQEKGKWNLKMEDGLDDSPIDPLLTLLGQHDEVLPVSFYEFAQGKTSLRGVPVKYTCPEKFFPPARCRLHGGAGFQPAQTFLDNYM